MSYALPRSNAPSFHDPQRAFESQAWGSSGRSRFQDHGHNNAVAEKIGGVFGDRKSSLPMYKDKPYHYAASGRRLRWFRRKRTLGGLLLIILGFLYWLGILSPSGKDIKDAMPRKSGWSLLSSAPKGPNWDDRREKVKDAFKLSWGAYERHAWGFDEFHPVTKQGRQMVPNGMGWIIVDALDTLMLMNLTTELTHAREWISTNLTYDQDHDVNTFETTIRMLGGLLSAHYLSTDFPNMAPLSIPDGSPGEDLYLEKATDLADRLLGAYESPSGVPFASVNLHTRKGIKSNDDGGASSTAEATSLQLEMKYLAKLTGETNYWSKAEKVMQVVDDNGMRDGLLPIFLYADRGTFRNDNIRLGSRGDSYYEYLIKQYLQTSQQEPIYQEMWNQSLCGVRKHLITYSNPTNLTVLAERPTGLDKPLVPKMDHLVCFMPGTIALGATGGKALAKAKLSPAWGRQQEEEMELARQLMKTCWGMYKVTPTGLAPEIAHFNIHDPPVMMEDRILHSPDELDSAADADWKQDYVIKPADTHNLQRPETVESLFYMWRITGDEKYREWGWEMFQSFVKYTAVEGDGGFSSINSVDTISPSTRDNMESFWLAETLKYFYLLFGPNDIFPLDEIVLNTEAHPFPRFQLGKLFSTGWKRKQRDEQGRLVSEKTPEEKKGGEVRMQTVTVAAAPAQSVVAEKVEAGAALVETPTSVV
ncbi:mannosyl-oligosaccharide alpha-1,2-mannosidase [Elasticomyces elasticus]|nr:mannosyl-oligosaccharide alpha-1,2-mannosidase [Elasticomyces elasticus]